MTPARGLRAAVTAHGFDDIGRLALRLARRRLCNVAHEIGDTGRDIDPAAQAEHGDDEDKGDPFEHDGLSFRQYDFGSPSTFSPMKLKINCSLTGAMRGIMLSRRRRSIWYSLA